MTKVLIVGAYGQIARVATSLFLQKSEVQLTLFLRNSKRLRNLEKVERVRIVEGSVLDPAALEAAVKGQDVVYANLDGPLEQAAKNIVAAMRTNGVKRLIFISSMGIDTEVPGEHYRSVLDPYRDAARVIEQSDLDYTIVRPAWLSDRDEVLYGTTRKGEPFRNAKQTVSRKSVADLVVKLTTTPGLELRSSLGVHHT